MQVTVKKDKEEEEIKDPNTSENKEKNSKNSDGSKIHKNEEINANKEGDKPQQTKKDKRKPIKVDISVTGKSLDELKALIRVREEERTKTLEKLKELNKIRDQVKEKRDELNQESAESFSKVSELKEKRDSTNKEIRELKDTRESVLAELKDYSKREREIIEKFRSSDEEKRITRKDARSIQKQIEKYEWQLQTVPNLSLDEQRSLMGRIETLSSKLGEVQVSEAAQRELKEIRKRKSNLKGFLDDSWKQLSELVSASQGRHNRLSELYETGKKSKQEADKSHSLFIKKIEETREIRERLRILKAELDVLYPAMKELQEKKRKVDQSIRLERNTVIKEEKRSEIKKKLSNKKGLSMEEMRFMMDNKLLSLKEEENND